jgi:hypothetical protein
VKPLRSVVPVAEILRRLRRDHRGDRGWATWRNLGLLLSVLVLPFGWLLPVAELARVRVAARRSRRS